jgi:RNA polymerase sigma-70 factor (ECF subfamily)
MDAQLEKYSDFQIIQRINDGDITLFEILIRRYGSFLYKIGRLYNHNHENTKDLMQDTYVNAYIHLKKFENRSSFKTWLTRIMLNQCYQKRHKLSFQNEIISDDIQNEKSSVLFHHSTNNEKIAINKELGRILENAIREIPEDYRIVFSLREINGLSVAETAEALNISENNVKVRMNRAKVMLRREIKKMYLTEDIKI